MVANTWFGLKIVVVFMVRSSSAPFPPLQEVLTIAGKTLEELREALIQKALGKRSNITVCVHGINKYYCTYCKQPKAKAPKTPKAAKAPKTPKDATPAADAAPVEKPEAPPSDTPQA